MNKAELINAMAEKSGLTKANCKKAVEAFVESVTTAMKEGDKVSLVGFGTFTVNERSARAGVNPSTKQPIEISAKKVAKFKAGKNLEDAIG